MDFTSIAANVGPLSSCRLSLTFGMARSQILEEVMPLVRRLQSLKRLFVRLPRDPYAPVHAADELRLECLVMGGGVDHECLGSRNVIVVPLVGAISQYYYLNEAVP